MRGCVIGLAVLLAISFAQHLAADDFQVQLCVRESAGVARKAGPMSGGIPLPKGMFKTGQPFALFNEAGKELPCQISSLVVETDGTLRWILVDFQDDLAASATNKYVLKAVSPKAKPSVALKVTDDGGAVTVDTGRMKFVIDKEKPFGLFESVEVGGKPVVTGGEVSYVQMYGRKRYDDPAKWKPRKLSAGPPDSVKVYYAGQMRVTIEVKGHVANDPFKAQYMA